MALDITAQDLIVDETTGLQDDDSSVSNSTVTYLLGLDGSGGLTSPQVAYQTNFVTASASAGETISSVVLSQDADGTPFSTSVGVNSGIQTVDGNYVWLFQDATHSNVVIGVIGTDDPTIAPAANGPLAFSFALVSTSSTTSDLYTVQYVPLLHPDGTNPDDTIDLADKVFASVSATTTASFLGSNAAPGNNDFYLINSTTSPANQLLVIGLNGGTANVSTQGFGVDNQSINPGETLQVDFVTGGNLAAGSASQIQYGSHIETITQAGFTINQITPSQPTKRVDISISAFNNTGDEQGSNFFDGTVADPVNITSITLSGTSGFPSPITEDNTYATASGDVVISGLGTGTVTIRGLDNVTVVDVTTSAPMDRLQVTGVDTNEGLDITEFHFSTTTPDAYTEQVGSFINFDDDGPAIDPSAATVPTLTTDDTDIPDSAGPTSFAGLFTADFGEDGFKDADDNNVQDADAISYALGVKDGGSNVLSGLTDTLTGDAVVLNKVGNDIVGTVTGTALEVLRISVDASTGAVTFTQSRSVVHNDPADPDEPGASAAGFAAADLVTLTATITDGDGDTDSATRNIGDAFRLQDDGPAITAPLDTDTVTGGLQTEEQLGNAVGQKASGIFGYDIGSDAHDYTAGGSDFVDADAVTPGVQISLTGTVDNAQNPGITQAVATLTAETATSATFAFSFHFDADPLTAGVQDATAGGTLVFDKVAGTYEFTLTDVVDGFSFEVLQTSEFLAKQPTGNTGQPLIVAEQLKADDTTTPATNEGFFVQFTGNAVTRQIGFGFNLTGDGAPDPAGDTTFNDGDDKHDMVTNLNETWVSATQSTNGVAGDTIQKGELLTLRFFNENILTDVDPGAPGGGYERLDPTQTASGIVVKFDGIGNSEDLVVILDLKAANGTEITRAINVQNSDLIKGNANIPAPYNTQFTLDNNDALLIIEQNDYTAAGETYQIQGMQIMQSANGLTGSAINLNGAVGTSGGSSLNAGDLTAFDPTDNDVLKIVDIGFVQQSSGTIDANLDFSFTLVDGDGDTTSQQTLSLHISNDYII